VPEPIQDTIIYEQPLNERTRTFLRLEHLFNQTAYTIHGFSVWDSRATLNGLLAILDLISRGDTKNELLKELDRLHTALTTLRNRPGVDNSQLDSVLSQIEHAQRDIHEQPGHFGQALREHELIATLRQRSSITGGDCNFDLPAYHHWLKRDPEQRISELESWFEQLDHLQKPVSLILAILRESNVPVEMTAAEGYFQQTLDATAPVQLLRVMLPQDVTIFPEISAGKHRVSIRFLEPRGHERPVKTATTVPFQICSCGL